MAPSIDDEADAPKEVDRFTGEVATTTRQAAEAELARFTTKTNWLTTDAARARQEADCACRALANVTQDPL
jgi:hypothetical protein